MTSLRFVVDGINPEQWSSPGATVVRSKGKTFARLTSSTAMKLYQEAVQDELRKAYPEVQPLEGPVAVSFFLWRQLVVYEGEKKIVTKNEVDATNCQKALEDAIQGVLIGNDKFCRHVETTMMEQGTDVTPLIVIEVGEWTPPKLDWLDEVHARTMRAHRERVKSTIYRDVDTEGVF